MPCDAGFCQLPSGASCALCSTPQACPRCGQTGAMCGEVCITCRAVDREPQGETVRLFEPAPTQIPGQLNLQEAQR
jgi:hypothetical protein